MMVQLFHRMSKQQNHNSTQVKVVFQSLESLQIRICVYTNNLYNFTLKPKKTYFVLFQAWVLAVSEYGCYLSSVLSLMMAVKLARIDKITKLTFINQMFLLYYSVDSVLGAHESYYLFRIFDEQ